MVKELFCLFQFSHYNDDKSITRHTQQATNLGKNHIFSSELGKRTYKITKEIEIQITQKSSFSSVHLKDVFFF